MFMEDNRKRIGEIWLLALGAVSQEQDVFSYHNVWWAWDATAKLPDNSWLTGGWRCYYTVGDTDVGDSPKVHDHPLDALNEAYKDIEARLAAAPQALLELLQVASTPVTLPQLDIERPFQVLFPTFNCNSEMASKESSMSALKLSDGIPVPWDGSTTLGDKK